MKWEKVNGKLKVQLLGSFNLLRVKNLEKLYRNCKELEIDLSRSRFVDTEAVAFLYRLKLEKFPFRLVNPPEVLNELLKVLNVKLDFK